MGEYGHGKPFSFPKEIFYMVIAAIILFGAGIFFGPHLLSAINSDVNDVNTDTNPANPVEIPKTGDTGQLPAVVNETMPAPKREEKVSDNIRIVGNGLKVERFDSTFQLSELRPGTIHFAEWNLGRGNEQNEQADFYIVVDRDDATILKNVVLKFKGTIVRNFTVIDNTNMGLVEVMAEIVPGGGFQRTASSLTMTSEIPFDPKYTFHSPMGRDIKSPKDQEILGSIFTSTSSEKERFSKTKIMFLRVIIIE